MKYDLERELSILDIPDEAESQKGDDLYSTSVRSPQFFKMMAHRILDVSLDDIERRVSELNGALMVREREKVDDVMLPHYVLCCLSSFTVKLDHLPSAQRCTEGEVEDVWHHFHNHKEWFRMA